MTLCQLLGWREPTTHRQFITYAKWQDVVWDEPSYTDWLIMRMAQRSHQGWAKYKGRVGLEDQLVKFQNRKDCKPEIVIDPAAATATSKARWGTVLKGYSVVKTPPLSSNGDEVQYN